MQYSETGRVYQSRPEASFRKAKVYVITIDKKLIKSQDEMGRDNPYSVNSQILKKIFFWFGKVYCRLLTGN